jgi:hypothetical protein
LNFCVSLGAGVVGSRFFFGYARIDARTKHSIGDPEIFAKPTDISLFLKNDKNQLKCDDDAGCSLLTMIDGDPSVSKTETS